MLWAVQFEWPSGAQITFNCYHQWDTIVVHDMGVSVHFFHIKEYINQGNPLVVIAYTIGILPLVHELCATHTQVSQLFYKDDTGPGVKFDALHEHMRYVLVRVPPRGYFLEPTKIILDVSP